MTSLKFNNDSSSTTNLSVISEHLIIQNKPLTDKLTTLKKVRQMINYNIRDTVNFIILPIHVNMVKLNQTNKLHK